MKQKKREARFLLLVGGILLSGAMPARSGDLYLYGTDGSKQTISLDDVRKLTFSDTELIVNKNSGEDVPMLFTSLQCFSLFGDLYPETGTNIAETPVSAADVSVFSIGNEIVVKSSQVIDGVNVYDLRGQKLVQLSPQTQEISISLDSYPTGIYIVQTVSASGITVKKIIKN